MKLRDEGRAGASSNAVDGSHRYGLDLLDFRLPEFTRLSWVGDAARKVWEPRMQRIGIAWAEIEWRAILAGIRSCCVTSVAPERLPVRAREFAKHGLNALPIELQGLTNYSYSNTSVKATLGAPFSYRVVLGTPADVADFAQAWEQSDQRRIGGLLGYPDCCREFFHQVWVTHHLRDTTWPMAVGAGLVEKSVVNVSGEPEANILWRWMGIRAVPHLPCSFDCRATIELGRRLVELGRKAGYEQEMAWMLDILRWPLEWSALHGIAEIKTPILKVSATTDATGSKFVVRRNGTSYPEEGARGLSFAYKSPARPLVTGSPEFIRGLDNPIDRPAKVVAPPAEVQTSPSDPIPVRLPSFKEREIEGDRLIYLDKNKRGWLLNPSAASIWALCDGRHTLSDICRELAGRMELPEAVLARDVGDTTAELAKLGLVRMQDRSSKAGFRRDIDWRRMAAPQEDGYDTQVILKLRAATGAHPPVPADGPALLEGRVAVRHCYERIGKGLENAPLSHANIDRAVDYLRLWPAVYEQFGLLMQAFHPAVDPRQSTDDSAFLSGSQCHSEESMPGTLWSTINCPLMLASNFVHELAHQKLFALGVLKESSTRLIENRPEELYVSPVIKDRLRPMTAVVHGEYAFVHVTELEMRAIEGEPEGPRRHQMLGRLRQNLARLKQGRKEIRAHVRLDEEGVQFFEGLYAWIGDLIARAKALLGGARPEKEKKPHSAVVKEAVRVFVGTEPRMEKAEIALEHAIRQHTSGPVEIVWMDYGRGGMWADWNVGRRRGNISSGPATGWATEFTCFRFAIPEACAFRGRAIYMDVDMIVLRDLRELFEMPMSRPVLTTPACTATMLYDCAFFEGKSWWPRVATMRPSGWGMDEYLAILKKHDARGPLSARWNCLDGQGYDEETGIVHFSRRLTQPWKPYPDVFDYRPHPRKELEALWWKHYEGGERERRGANLERV